MLFSPLGRGNVHTATSTYRLLPITNFRQGFSLFFPILFVWLIWCLVWFGFLVGRLVIFYESKGPSCLKLNCLLETEQFVKPFLRTVFPVLSPPQNNNWEWTFPFHKGNPTVEPCFTQFCFVPFSLTT